MNKKLPKHVVEKYGSTRAFREDKRRRVREMTKILDQLSVGCAYLPSGSRGIKNVGYELQILAHELSVKNWGR